MPNPNLEVFMGVLVECPKCRMKHPTQRRICQTKSGKGCGASLSGGKRMYWIEYYVDGQRKRERIGTNYKLAASTYDKRKAEIAEGRFLNKPKGASLRFGALMDWYLALPAVKAKRSYNRDCLSASHLKAFFKDRLVKNLKLSMVDQYKQERLATKNQTSNFTKPATVNRELACLRHALNLAVQDGKLDSNPITGIKLLKESNVRDRVLSPAEFERLLGAAANSLKPILVTAYYTGMRRGEIINLTWDQVDLKEGFVHLEPENTKTGEARIVPLHPEVIKALGTLPRAIHHDRVFTKADGSPITNIRKGFEKARKRAGLDGFRFHDFRHTAITNWRRAGHDYFKIMAATGHKTMSVFKRYNTVDKTDLKTLVSPPMDTYMDTKPTNEHAVKKQGLGLST